MMGYDGGQAYDITIYLDGGSKLTYKYRPIMARQRRVELEGGLYHVIARGNNRQDIFHSNADHKKFLSLLSTLKQKLPFYLYAIQTEMAGRAIRPPETQRVFTLLTSPDPTHKPTSPRRWTHSV